MADDRGVRHFDRKFVASNLKNLLRCPKCSKDYTHSQGEHNHRPFLLPCGHNLCESCLWKNRQNLTCAVCQKPAPPLINAKDPASKSGVRVCDFYELNYHVLGEASSLLYFRDLETEAVNESLALSLGNDVIIRKTMCSECAQADAMGECSQCNAFYCRHCFEAVHKHSRVLKSHTFHKMSVERSSPQRQEFRVGNELFAMPVERECRVHRLPMNIFCIQCRRSMCRKCMDIYHASHKKKPLLEMNQRLSSEIPSTLRSLKSAMRNIHNGQEVVRAAKQKLSGYASEALASVSKRFCHLHGLLQVAELQVVEQLRESSLPPQMELNEAMGKLSGYEALIKRLMEYLENGPQNTMGVPTNVWLSDLIKLISQHLEKIPSIVQVSKIMENPYRIYSDHIDIASIIENKIKCKFVDPNIQVTFKTYYERDRTISSINPDITFSVSSSSGKENACQSNIMRTQQQPLSQKSNFKSMSNSQKRQAIKSSKSSLNFTTATSDSFQQQKDFVRSFSALDISKPNATSAVVAGDWFKTDALVRVRSITSPEDFYVQGIHAVQRVREELDCLTPYTLTGGSRFTPPEIVVGHHYITFHQDQNRFYRAMVSQKLATQKDTYKVFLPDVGLYVEMHNSDFREMPERLAHLPYSAVHCSLRDLMPSQGGSEWDTGATSFLKQMVQNNPVHVIVKKAVSHDLHEVDLITGNYSTNISVRDSFLYSGLARSRCGRAPVSVLKSLQQYAPINLRLPRATVQVGDVIMVQMLHVEQPQEFYVMRHDYESKRCLQQSTLQRYMDRVSLSMLENIYLGRLHLGCVLQSEGQWKRARIEQILPDGYVLVHLVDDGPSQKVFWDQLFVLPHVFWEPELAIKCALADVETLPEMSYVWTPEATACFKQLTSNPKLHIEVTKISKDVVYVALSYTRSGSETTNVAVQMIAQGHCTSSGESSRVFNKAPASQRSMRLDVDTRRLLDQQKAQPVELKPFRQAERAEDRDKKRTKVKVLYVRQPDEFYVTLPHFQSAFESLQKTVQVEADDMYQSQKPRTDWSVGDMCYVRVQAQSDLDVLWHRGVITKVISPSRYHVQLRDFGQVAEDVPTNCLTSIDEASKSISSTAKRCHLHGVQAVGNEWSDDAIDFFKDQLQGYDQVYVTGHGYKGNSLSVVLWGTHTVISGPFSPARTKFVNINKTLLRVNLAEKNLDSDSDMNETQPSMTDKASITSVTTANSKGVKAMQSWLDKIDKSKSSNSPVETQLVRPGFEHNEDMPPLELLDDLGKDKVTTGQTVPPAGWTTSRKCDKTIFTGIATNVTYECRVYLTLGNDKPYVEHMRSLLERHYKPLMEKQQQQNRSFTYEVGQPVLATYHMDNLLYRGIVQRLRNNHDEYTVFYVDYGNLEQVKADEMLPYAPFPQLNAMCWLVNIHGVRPKGAKYTIKQMDTVHQHLVMKLSSVRVVEPSGVGTNNNLPSCSIKVGNVDIAAMMIDCGMAVPVDMNQARAQKSPQHLGLEAFKVFDELENLARSVAPGEQPLVQQQPQRRNETNSSVHQPPAKKKYVVDAKEVNRFENDQDFDCQQAAQDMYSFFCPDSDGYCVGEREFSQKPRIFDIRQDDELVSDFSGHEMDIDIEDDDGDGESSGSRSDVSQMEPLSVSAATQLQRRIDLRHKDMKENVIFSPMDTSTVRSFFDGSSSFKTLSLPTGVKQFQCSVDNVLSATELQIAPCLSEFTKHDISLVQETSVLIKGAAALTNPKLNDLCLARYSKDKQWYRAIVKEIQESTQQATVFYIDFHDTERVSYAHLKEMPSQLFMFPLRSFRVKLHGVKKNKNFEDKTVRQCLRACLCKYALVFARVHYPFNYHANQSAHSDAGEFDLIEVELFEDRHKKKLVYQSLIESWMLLPKKKN